MLHNSHIGFNCSLDYVIIVYEVFPLSLLSILFIFLIGERKGEGEEQIPI